MDAFITAHGDTGSGEDLYANCELCGAYEPLGLGFSADDDAIEEALALWMLGHICGQVQEYGLREHTNDGIAAKYFGLPEL